MSLRIVRIDDAPGLAAFKRRLEDGGGPQPADERKVRRVLESIRRQGDAALLPLMRRYDGYRGNAAGLRVSRARMSQALEACPRDLRRALTVVAANIKAYQTRLLPTSWRRHLRPGVLLGQRVSPLRRVGIYVPGGQAPLVSSVLMCAIPAKVAGVKELVLCTPAGKDGVDERILAAAALAGVNEVYTIGGAQAIAAMAYGTRSVPKVDKIVGPGSKWVALAKRLLYGTVGLDMVAGPSEALVIADESAPPAWVAADLLSQAEHAGDETALLICTSERLARETRAEVDLQLAALPRRKIARASLKGGGLIVVVRDMAMAIEAAGAVAPEHLQLMVRSSEQWIPRVRNAGAIFVGPYSPVVLGDLLAGPSHVLPTGGSARYSNGLSAEDFLVKSSIIRYDRQALASALPDLRAMSAAEGLEGHYRSAQIRVPRSSPRPRLKRPRGSRR